MLDWTDDKPLPKPTMTNVINAYMQQLALISENVNIYYIEFHL